MTPRERFLRALAGERVDQPSVGNPTSIATVDLMERTGGSFPFVHTDAGAMVRLASAGFTELGYDTIAPYFSVVAEAAALGALIDWGDPTHMPTVRPLHLLTKPEQVAIPADFLFSRSSGPARVNLPAVRSFVPLGRLPATIQQAAR